MKAQELFFELEGARGKSSAELSMEIEAEYKLWENHFAYIQRRKNEATSGTGNKIRKNEIIETFERFVKPHYQMVEVEGYEVYFSLESLDLGRANPGRLTNMERLVDSLCPIGSDGEIMNYHHLTHHDAKTHASRSVIVLVTNKLHTQFSGSLHFANSNYRDLPRAPLNRAEFARARNGFGPKILERIKSAA